MQKEPQLQNNKISLSEVQRKSNPYINPKSSDSKKKVEESLQGSKAKSRASIEGLEYNPLKIPCDWAIAQKHGLSRRTAPDIEHSPTTFVDTCPCCGFEVDRQIIDFWDPPSKSLSFLGSGFPLFFNFIKYCVILLFTATLVKGIYNIKTNYEGNYCQIKRIIVLENGGHLVEPNCPDSILLKLSLANKLNQPNKITIVSYLNFISLFIIMITLLYFRKSQRQMDSEIDESQLTPADYTVCVKNIPKQLNIDYRAELKYIFENYAVTDPIKTIEVKKVVLVYDIEEIIDLEKSLDLFTEKKKEAIIKNNYNYHAEDVKKVDEQIELIEEKIKKIEEEQMKEPSKFAGIAFVSFNDEDQKNLVLEQNQHTRNERFQSFLNKGKTEGLTSEDLSWNGQKLFIEIAPEPNDVDWEFIHVQTEEKIINRIKAILFYILFEFLAFYAIYLISLYLAKMQDKAQEELAEGHASQSTVQKISILSHSINFLIVLFNKFGVAYVIHQIVDSEKISGKTKFQISFAHKYAIALFLNAAMISYVVDIIILKNVYGQGGFISNESQIFVLNAFFPPLVWFIDPWYLCKNLWRRGIMANKETSLYTQAEANKWMENPDYLSAKRYSDIMKTMWFTFLYATAIPLGPIVSCLGLICYYYIDKYNLIYRRTVKESISIILSNEMIEMLELIIFFSAMGSMTMSFTFFGKFEKIDIILLIIALLYNLAPMDKISEYIFPVVNKETPVPYDVGKWNFDTDYDRENPITKNEAIKEWNIQKQNKKLEFNDNAQQHHRHNQQAPQLFGGYNIQHDNYGMH